jgi:hypothetical protein
VLLLTLTLTLTLTLIMGQHCRHTGGEGGEGEAVDRGSYSQQVRCAFFGRNLHSRMPLDPTHVRLKRTCV